MRLYDIPYINLDGPDGKCIYIIHMGCKLKFQQQSYKQMYVFPNVQDSYASHWSRMCSITASSGMFMWEEQRNLNLSQNKLIIL